ncbi:MAG: hypothetical protein OQK73_02145 [Gammaproteobacteria bacterium]|nr:hypothetical protein [Gammaproteobacteria bacterium]
MQSILGWILIIFPGALFLIQLVSSLNFPLAQKLGLQEKVQNADPLLIRSERYTAYWDLVSLVWLPVAGILMVINHSWWPAVSLIGGAIYIDAAGREAAKNLSFRHEGIKAGTKQEQSLFFSTYIAMIILGLFVIIYSLQTITAGY